MNKYLPMDPEDEGKKLLSLVIALVSTLMLMLTAFSFYVLSQIDIPKIFP